MYGELGFPVGDHRGAQLLAVAVEGRFDSYFRDKPSPLLTDEEDTDAGREPAEAKEKELVITRVIDRSPESARIILFASRSFLTDTMLDLASSGMGTRYLKPVQLVENAIDWSLEDRGLLAIRGRAHFSRTLNPLDRESQLFWEYLNYGLPLLGLLLIGLIRRQTNKRAAARYAAVLGTAE
jgi:ABC-2 type transport system permease protein